MSRPAKFLLTLVSAAVIATTAAPAAIDARLVQEPDVSATTIAFVYAGDIWLVPKQGGQAARLSTPPGEESFPRFSPDGSRLAYTAAYDGNEDAYVVPVAGGVPTRLTYHPMNDRVVDWYPDGSAVLVASSRESGKQRFNQFYRVPDGGGLPSKLPIPYGEFGSLSPDGKVLAYVPISVDFRTWKRYRGGMASDIWLFDLESKTSKRVSPSDAVDSMPMWHGSTLYFLSDRGAAERSNIWAYDLATGAVRQVTRFTDYDTHTPAIGPSDMVFENGGRLYVLDLATEKAAPIEIEVVTDRATLKPRTIDVAGLVQDAAISPTGKRAAVQARGELFSVPAEHGVVLNLTNSSGVAERFPAWSPDGKEIAYFSDRGGEYELTVRPAGGGAETSLTKLGPGFRYHPYWSPDGKKIAFIDQTMTIRIADRESGKVTDVDRGLWMFQGPLNAFRVSWSADSRYMAYSRGLDNRAGTIFVYDVTNGERRQVTSGFYAASEPTFDPDGKYLYFLTNREFDASYSDFDNTWIYPNSTEIAALSLRADVPSPLAPRNDVEGKKDESKKDDGKNGDDAKGDKKKDKSSKDAKKQDEEKKPEPVKIDFDGLESRITILPARPGNYRNLYAVSGKVLYLRRPNTGSADKATPLLYWDLEGREEKKVLDDVDSYEPSLDGKKLLVAQKGKLAITDLREGAKADKALDTGSMKMTLDPPAEWRQLFDDAWRFERDFFYDPNLHGVDWNEMKKRYGALLDDAVTRWDVNFVLGELIAELSSSHTYRGGGDLEQAPKRGVGLLGVDFALDSGAYRIARIVRPAEWESEVRSPLDRPGVDVKAGDWLLAVNGVPLDTTKDPWAAFQGSAGETVELTVNSKPTLEGSHKIVVETMPDETRLRNLAWIESNRRRVEELSGGRVGYVYVPDTGRNGQNELVRQFGPQFTKPALVIDERFNNGGQIPDRFIELLDRPIYNFWAVRDGRDWQWPPIAQFGPKVMLINGWSGSGGDCFPLYFKMRHLGPLIGTRTWGGLIGISGSPPLIDGGFVTVPTFSIYGTDGQWLVEGHGVDPDIEVVDDPALMLDGGDPQLDRAVQEALALLEKNPPPQPKRPPYPKR